MTLNILSILIFLHKYILNKLLFYFFHLIIKYIKKIS